MSQSHRLLLIWGFGPSVSSHRASHRDCLLMGDGCSAPAGPWRDAEALRAPRPYAYYRSRTLFFHSLYYVLHSFMYSSLRLFVARVSSADSGFRDCSERARTHTDEYSYPYINAAAPSGFVLKAVNGLGLPGARNGTIGKGDYPRGRFRQWSHKGL